MPLFLFGLAGVSILAVLFLFLIAHFYVVVKPNQAHVIVSGRGRKVYSPSTVDGVAYPTSYIYIPILMQRIIVSLENVKHEINDIELRDLEVAPFKCDITCWFKITDPDLAAEKLDVDEDGNIMESIRHTLNAQVNGVARAVAMKQEVIDLMRNRKGFRDDVFEEVNGDLDDWGVQLVKLEIIDFKDGDNSHVLRDYELRREAFVEAETRKTVAQQNKEAEVEEADSKKLAETAKLESSEAIALREIDKEQQVGIRNEQARLEVAKAQDEANAQEVAAEKTKAVGKATYEAEAKEIVAAGEAKAEVKKSAGKADGRKLEAAADAEAVLVKGTAEADVAQKKGIAEATALEKKADAQKKFTDVSKDIEMAQIAADIEKTKYGAMAQALEKANIQIVSKDMSFMGFGANEGAGLGAMAKALEATSGISIPQLVNAVADQVTKSQPDQA
jgi:flotillin